MDRKFIELLKPQNIFMDKKRLGPLEDGGYVMPEFVFNNCSALFTYGVGNEIRFEEEFTRVYNKPSYLFDHTIGREEWKRDGLCFFPEGLGTLPNCKEFIDHYKFSQITGYVLLKIDIESGEYQYFKNTDMSKFESTVIGMSLEVHWIDNLGYRESLIDILSKIEEYFVLCHIHGNNWGELWNYEELIIPKVLELSFINKKFVSGYEVDQQDYPIIGIDFPNRPGFEDYKLTFLK